jgi:hypothetical protein
MIHIISKFVYLKNAFVGKIIAYTANVYRDLQGLCRGFSALSAGKTL